MYLTFQIIWWFLEQLQRLLLKQQIQLQQMEYQDFVEESLVLTIQQVRSLLMVRHLLNQELCVVSFPQRLKRWNFVTYKSHSTQLLGFHLLSHSSLTIMRRILAVLPKMLRLQSLYSLQEALWDFHLNTHKLLVHKLCIPWIKHFQCGQNQFE